MKATKRLSWLLVASVLAGVSAPVMAQNQGRSPSGLMGVLDRNGNGKLEPEEIDLAVASLRKLDKNKDGIVTREEVGGSQRPARPQGSQRQPNLSDLDKDGDGKISKDEAPERMKERFDRIDQNGDGFIDAKEQEALLQMLRGRSRDGQRPGQPQRRPGGSPGSGDGQGGTDKPRRPDARPEEK
jgi:hypothetical protein